MANSLKADLTGRVVVFKKECFLEKYRGVEHRRLRQCHVCGGEGVLR